MPANEKAKSELVSRLTRMARKERLNYNEFIIPKTDSPEQRGGMASESPESGENAVQASRNGPEAPK